MIRFHAEADAEVLKAQRYYPNILVDLGIAVIAVAHGKRKPDNCKKRLKNGF